MLVGSLLAWPTGEFPTNDDFIFFKMVRQLHDNASLKFDVLVEPTAIAHALWGLLITSCTGISFQWLRIAVLLLAVIGIIQFYKILALIEQNHFLLLLAGTLLAFNPFFFHLSHSFMTDVSFCCFVIFSVRYYLLSFAKTHTVYLLVAAGWAAVAVLTRQLGLVLPVAAIIAILVKWRFRPPYKWYVLVIATLLPFIALWSYNYLIIYLYGKHPEWYNRRADHFWQLIFSLNFEIIYNIVKHAYYAALNIGLFILPLLLVTQARVRLVGWAKIIGILFVLFTTLRILWQRPDQLTVGNLLFNCGMAPLTLYDFLVEELPNYAYVADSWFGIAGFLGACGGAVLGVRILSRLRQIDWLSRENIPIATVFILLVLLIYLIPLLILGYFDRYLLPLWPLSIILILQISQFNDRNRIINTVKKTAALSLTGAMLFFSVTATHDYFSWQRARWELIRAYVPGKISPYQIDAGYEFHGLHTYRQRWQMPRADLGWYWVRDNTFMLTFGPYPGYTEIDRRDFIHWMPPGASGSVLLLQKNTAANK